MRDLIFRSFVLLLATAMIANAMNYNTNESNPLLAKWEGPYGGVPPFDKVQIPLFKPALEAAMAEQLKEIEQIAANPAAPRFRKHHRRIRTRRPHAWPRRNVVWRLGRDDEWS